MDGYFGACSNVALDIRENTKSSTIIVYHESEVEPHDVVDAVDAAASYVLGIALDPMYAAAEGGGRRSVFMASQPEGRTVDQAPAPLDLRLQATELLAVFNAFFVHALRHEGTLRQQAHALVLDVYQTFKSGYLPHQILMICIAIEALLRKGASEKALPESFTKNERKALADAVAATQLSDSKKKRVASLLTQLNSASVGHLFDEAISQGLLDSEHRRAWYANRSIFAHGSGRDEKGELLVDRMILLNAFHRLIHRSIGIALDPMPPKQDEGK
jgi:hypothetical protein